jgi:predicted nucleic acid-binding protein
MPAAVLVDTDILIDVARGNPRAVAFMKELSDQVSLNISIVTQMELLVGCRNKEEQKSLDTFLSNFRIIELNAEISLQAVSFLKEYRLSHGLLIADALIAATASWAGISLVTRNLKDYRFIAGLELMEGSSSSN